MMQQIKDLEVWIDGVKTLISNVFPFYQQDPYPGDHTYRLRLSVENEHLMKQFINLYKLSETDGNAIKTFFFGLSAYWSEEEASRSTKYFLNNVQQTVVDGNSIIINGVSSTIV